MTSISDAPIVGGTRALPVIAAATAESTLRRYDSSDVTVTLVVPGPITRRVRAGEGSALVTWLSNPELLRQLAQSIHEALLSPRDGVGRGNNP